jgi:dihydrofolate synthase/folylpolyglutamate synthase
MLTAAAIKHMRDQRVDLLVCEVGMGGRLDSTNVLALGVKVITGIALDHQQYLGDTIAAIAAEKAGIVHAGDRVVTATLRPEAAAVVETRCDAVGATLERLGAEWTVSNERDLGWHGGELTLDGPGVSGLRLGTPLVGPHQRGNAALAAAAALTATLQHDLRVTVADVRAGLAVTRWPGRLEPVAGRPGVLIDGGHNPDAVARVVSAVRGLVSRGRVVCVFGAMADKDWPAMVALLPRSWPAVYTAVTEARACAPAELLAEASRQGREGDEAVDGVADALARGQLVAGPEGTVLVLGSLYLAGAVRDALGLPLLG